MAIADLSITKTASPDPVGVGQLLTYTIVVRNNGPDQAIFVEAQDTLPNGVCISDITVGQGSYCYENGTITWKVGTLNVGADATLTVSVIPQSAGVIGNTAIVYHVAEDEDSEPDEDPENDNNTADLEVTVTPIVDLAIIKVACPSDTVIGRPIDYSITVINNGPSAATNVTVTDVVPAEMEINEVSSSGTCQQLGNTVTCNLGTLAMNERGNVKITVTPTVEGPIENSAVVTSDELDSNPENNEDSIITNVGQAADISISKMASSSEVVVGQLLTYTVIVTNNGPSQATNVTVKDILPENVDIVSITPGSYNQTLNVIDFDLGNLNSMESTQIVIQVKPTEEGMLVNEVSAAADEEDPNPCNNMASVCTFVTITGSTDISVTKTHSPEPAGICSPVLYTITVENNGLISATGIVLVDQLPPSLEVLSVNSSQGQCCICAEKGNGCSLYPCHEKNMARCDDDNGHCQENDCGDCNHNGRHEDNCKGATEVVCQLGALGAGKSTVVEILARPRVLGIISNTAIVTANETDTDTTNNEATDTLNVITVCEQIDNLINAVNVLIVSGDIAQQYGQTLINMLNAAGISVCSGNECEAVCEIKKFINKVKLYIKKEIISKAQGCELIKAAELIIAALECQQSCCKDRSCEPC